jgi:hypothetical protein
MMEETLINKVYELTKKHMKASDVDFIYGIILRDGPPQIVNDSNGWVVYVPPLRRPERFVINLSQELAHAFHHLLSEGAYIKEVNISNAPKAQNINEANKLMIEFAKKQCWEEGVPCRVAEKNLADYFQDSGRARRTIEDFMMKGDVVLPMQEESNSLMAIGLSKEAALFSAFRNTIATHYAYLLGYAGLRDLSDETFYNLLRQKDAHKDPLLPWNGKWEAKLGSEVRRLVKAMDYRTEKYSTKVYGITDFSNQYEIRDLLVKNLVK